MCHFLSAFAATSTQTNLNKQSLGGQLLLIEQPKGVCQFDNLHGQQFVTSATYVRQPVWSILAQFFSPNWQGASRKYCWLALGSPTILSASSKKQVDLIIRY
jgi:hypothetical protein